MKDWLRKHHSVAHSKPAEPRRCCTYPTNLVSAIGLLSSWTGRLLWQSRFSNGAKKLSRIPGFLKNKNRMHGCNARMLNRKKGYWVTLGYQE